MLKIKISLKGEEGFILRPGEVLRLEELPDIGIENSEDIKNGKNIYVVIKEVQNWW